MDLIASTQQSSTESFKMWKHTEGLENRGVGEKCAAPVGREKVFARRAEIVVALFLLYTRECVFIALDCAVSQSIVVGNE